MTLLASRGLLARVARLLGRSPTVRLRLDEMGSLVWLRCDGSRTVAQILEEVEERMEPSDAPAGPRLDEFLRSLARQRLITFERSR